MIEKIPTWSLCYLVNGDKDNLTDDEIEMIDKWWTENNVQIVSPVSNDEGDCFPYFDPFPAFGLASDVIDCSVAILK